MKKLVLIPIAAIALGACDKTPPETVMSQQLFKYKNAQVEKQIDNIPDWFTSIPQEDNAVFAVGTAVTPDLQLSVDIATLSAKTTLADRINSKLRSQLKTFKSKLGANDYDNQLMHEFEQATINLIADADVAGYSVKESSIVSHGTQYRAYVLLEYTDGEAAKIIKNRVAKDEMLLSKLVATKAWADLDAKVDASNKTDAAELKDMADAISGLQAPQSVIE